MNDQWQHVSLGECLEPVNRAVSVAGLEEVPFAGVRWYAAGVYGRTVTPAREVKTKRLARLEAGDITYNRMWATKAAFGVVNDEAADWLVTNDFPTFVTRPNVQPEWFRLIFQTGAFQDAAERLAVGTTERRRLHQDAFLSITVPVPPLVVQRRIVDLMEHLDTHLANLETEQQSWNSFMKSLRARVFSDLDVPEVPAGEKFDMLLGRQKSERQSTGDHVIPYLRAANIGEAGFRLSDVGTMNFDLREQAKYGLRDGDVLLVEGGSIGLSALWTSQIPGTVGFDKHVIRLRPVEGTSTSSFALQWTRWCHESGAFDDQATGITIRALGFGRASQMPVPDLSVEQQDRLMAPLSQAETHQEALRTEIVRLQTFRAAALSSLLARAHAIPASYDALLAVS